MLAKQLTRLRILWQYVMNFEKTLTFGSPEYKPKALIVFLL